jgi:nitrile hydratase accessory protein
MNTENSSLALFLPDGEEPVFAAPWEAHAFALTVQLYERGLFSWAEWSQRLAEAIHSNVADDDVSYYVNWLQALENLLTDKGIIDSDEYEQGVRQLLVDSAAADH